MGAYHSLYEWPFGSAAEPVEPPEPPPPPMVESPTKLTKIKFVPTEQRTYRDVLAGRTTQLAGLWRVTKPSAIEKDDDEA